MGILLGIGIGRGMGNGIGGMGKKGDRFRKISVVSVTPRRFDSI
jgi:hypothetical protein